MIMSDGVSALLIKHYVQYRGEPEAPSVCKSMSVYECERGELEREILWEREREHYLC